MTTSEHLERWASGLLDLEAGVAILVNCTMTERLIPLFVEPEAGTDAVWVDIERAKVRIDSAGLSGGERRVAQLILGFLGAPIPVAFGDLVCGIDDRNIAIALNAIAHAAGWHERGLAATVIGRITADLDDVAYRVSER